MIYIYIYILYNIYIYIYIYIYHRTLCVSGAPQLVVKSAIKARHQIIISITTCTLR